MKRQTPFDQLCEVPTLMQAWKHVRANRGMAGIDLVSIGGYERELLANLQDLAGRLREQRYYPMPPRTFEKRKPNGKTRTLGVYIVEDRLVQRAALNAMEPLWEPSFAALECNFGFRPGRNVELAVKRVLDFRVAGDAFVVDADIRDCFGSLDHQLALDLIGARVRDKRMLALVRMWLDTGQVLPDAEQAALAASGGAPLIERVSNYAAGAVDEAVTQMLGEQGGFSRAGYGRYPDDEESLAPLDAGEAAAESRRAARKELARRIGKDALFLGLTYLGRNRRLLSPAKLALTGAAVLGAAVYPTAARAVRERFASGPSGAVQGSPLSPLIANIVLHEFDAAMIRAGFHLTRFADDWVITCRDERAAQQALEAATRKLAGLRLEVNPDKTRIIGFEQGLTFLGYKFDQFQPTATPAPTSTQRPISVLWREAPAALSHARETIAPAVSRAAETAVARVKEGVDKVTALFKRDRRDRKDGTR